VWEYRGSPIGRASLVKLFASVLRRDADGRHYLVTPAGEGRRRVADAPFLAVEMEVRAAGRAQELIFRTNVDDLVSVGAEHPLRFEVDSSSGGLKPYLAVRGRLEAAADARLVLRSGRTGAGGGRSRAAARVGVERGHLFCPAAYGDEPTP
jgi:hypothetical protein